MRHRRRSRVLGRSPSHRKALLKNLASALFLTEIDKDEYLDEKQAPKVTGRIVTTMPKAKEVRPLVERCITIARSACRPWRMPKSTVALLSVIVMPGENGESKQWSQWAAAIAPAVNARRRVLQLLGNKRATKVCFEVIAPRFADRPGGYTRILRLATPRLGDAGTRAVLEFVGVRGPSFEAIPGSKVRKRTGRSEIVV